MELERGREEIWSYVNILDNKVRKETADFG